ncbi:MAG: alpha/beta hydrolase [Gemmatimonadota bacterium]
MTRPRPPATYHQRYWAPDGDDPVGALLAVHGLSEHAGRYEGLAAAALDVGLATAAVDLHGHGKSPGRRGHVDSFEADHLGAVDALVRRVETDRPDMPLVLVGHSLGGLIVARWAQRRVFARRLRGLVLIAPFVAPRMPIPGWKLAVAAALEHVWPSLRLATGIADEDVFRDPAERARFAADPLVQRKISVGHWASLTEARERLDADAAELEIPTLFLLAGDDRVVSTDAARKLAGRMPAATIIEYPEAFHALLHDPLAREVVCDLLAWTLARMEDGAEV